MANVAVYAQLNIPLELQANNNVFRTGLEIGQFEKNSMWKNSEISRSKVIKNSTQKVNSRVRSSELKKHDKRSSYYLVVSVRFHCGVSKPFGVLC